MLALKRGVGILVVLLAATVAWTALAADNGKPSEEKQAAPKLKLKAADAPAEEAAEEADPFVVPDGTPKELVEYVEKLIATPPRDAETRDKMRKAILEAAEKILAGKPDEEELSFAVEAKMNMLEDSEQLNAFAEELQKAGRDSAAHLVRSFIMQIDLSKVAMSDPKDAKEVIENALKFFEESTPQVSDIRLAFLVGRLAEMGGDQEFTIKTFDSLSKSFAKSKDPNMADVTTLLEGVVRRLQLVGQEAKIEGKLLGEGDFDFAKYRGKVVLVNFWATAYPASVRELPDLKGYYDAYHDKGFDIVGVCLDRDVSDVDAFVKDKDIPWAIVTGDGKPSPAVLYYGVLSLPTTFLVDREGKVIAVNPTPEELKAKLEELFGKTEEKSEK